MELQSDFLYKGMFLNIRFDYYRPNFNSLTASIKLNILQQNKTPGPQDLPEVKIRPQEGGLILGLKLLFG